ELAPVLGAVRAAGRRADAPGAGERLAVGADLAWVAELARRAGAAPAVGRGLLAVLDHVGAGRRRAVARGADHARAVGVARAGRARRAAGAGAAPAVDRELG